MSRMLLRRITAAKGEVQIVGFNSGTGTTVSYPAHAVGDVLLAYTFRDGSNTQPGLISGHATWSGSGAGANTCSDRLQYKIATSTTGEGGASSSATGWVCYVLRNVDVAAGLGQLAVQGGTGTTITYPAGVTPFLTNTTYGNPLIIRFAGHRTATNLLTNTPAGYTARTGVATEARGIDTGGTTITTVPTSATQSVNASSGWRSMTVEIKPIHYDPPKPKLETLVDAFSAATDVTRWTDVPGSGNTISQNGTIPGAVRFQQVSGLTLTRTSVASFDMTDSKFTLQMGVMSASGVSPYIGFQPSVATGWMPGFWVIASNTVYASDGVNGLGTLHSHTSGDWYRMRESGGTLVWEFSANGTTWTTMHSGSLATILSGSTRADYTNGKFQLFSGSVSFPALILDWYELNTI